MLGGPGRINSPPSEGMDDYHEIRSNNNVSALNDVKKKIVISKASVNFERA